MRASLVWPAICDYSSLDTTWLPHGVCQIATEANERGHEVDVLDGRTLGMKGLKSQILATDSEVIGFSVLSAYAGYAKELIEFTRKHREDLLIVIGGIHPTVCDDFDDYDYLVKGEGELTFTDILEGKVDRGIVEGKHPDLAELKAIDRSLVSIDEEPLPGLEKPFATVIIGRGCPHRCTFCYPAERKLFGNRVRMRPAAEVAAELESLKVKSFMIHDDCFTAEREYVREFCGRIHTKGLSWWCQGRADNVVENMDMVREMRDAGLKGMILGHESGDDRVLKSLKKGTSVAQNMESVRFLKSLGVTVWSNIMLGTPEESPSAVINTIAFVQAAQPDLKSITVFTPHPGSELYDVCEERGIIPEHDYSYYNRGKFEEKIVGPDYAFLGWAAQQMQ